MKKYVDKCWRVIEYTVRLVLQFIINLVHKEFSENLFNSLMQFIKFGIVGISNVLISYILYVLFLLIFQQFVFFKKIDYIIAQSIAFPLSVLWSFYWNNKMVFTVKEGHKRRVWKALFKTFIAYSFTGLFLNNILLYLWIQMFGISEFIAPFINLVVSVPTNFLINKFWAFKQ